MKRKTYRQITGFCLSIFTALSLCACGRAAGENRSENENPAKEHICQFREVAVPDLGGDEADILASCCRNRRVRLLVKVTDWENYNDNDIRILSFQDEDSEAAVSCLETIPWKPAAENDSGPTENSYYDNFTFGADEKIYAIRHYHHEDSQSPDGDTGTAIRYLCCWATDGTLLWESQMGDFPSDDGYVSVNSMSVTAEGEVRLILTGDHAWQISVGPQGSSYIGTQLSDDLNQAIQNSATVIPQADGCLLLVCNEYLISYDPATGALGEVCDMPSSHGWDGYGAITAAGSGILYSSRSGIFSYVPGDAESTEQMNFINSDLNVSIFDTLVWLDDTSFAGVFYEGYSGRASMGIFTHVDPSKVPDRSVLVLSGAYISDEVIQRVVEFNRSNDQYRILVKNVEEYDSEETLAAGITKMTEDIFYGNMPDILVTSGLPSETYAAGGLLADIGKFIEEDTELSQTEFLQNVFDAYSIEGKLYYVIPSFEVGSLIGSPSVIGDRASWTFADALQLLETLPAGTGLIPEANRTSFLQTMMTYCGSELIDTKTATCNFQSRNFLNMIEYAKSLPEESDMELYDENYWRNYEAQFLEGRTLLAGMSVSSFSDVNYYVNGIFGEEASYIGFPTEDGIGSYIRAEESYAISAHSAHPEGAWEFLRYYLTDEYQSDLEWGLPIQKKYFLENSRSALREQQTYQVNGESATLEPMTEEALERLITFILSVNRRYYDNQEITNIVTEETAAFFAGDKTAQEAAEIIQRRAQIYVDTNMK